MRSMILIVCAGLACQPCCGQPKEAAPADPRALDDAWKALEGRWKRVGQVSPGTNYTDLSNDGFELEISRDRVKRLRDGKLLSDGEPFYVFVIDPAKDPKHLDMCLKQGDKRTVSAECIYRIEGDRLDIVLCRGCRPTTFNLGMNADADAILLTEYRRVKEERPKKE